MTLDLFELKTPIKYVTHFNLRFNIEFNALKAQWNSLIASSEIITSPERWTLNLPLLCYKNPPGIPPGGVWTSQYNGGKNYQRNPS